MTESERVERDRRHRKPVTIHDGGRKVRVKPLRFDPYDSEQVETVARAFGYFNFSDWRSGMKMKAQRPDDRDGIDGRRRSPLPRFTELDQAWRVLNWFALHPAEHPVRIAFWELMGPNWRNLPVDSWVLACRIMDCAFSVITKGNERGWL